jgi:hypothetical protein
MRCVRGGRPGARGSGIGDLIEGAPMDRRTASKDVSTALLAASLAIFVFGMTFVFAIFYIA